MRIITQNTAMDMDLILFEGKTFMTFCFEAKNLKRKDTKVVF